MASFAAKRRRRRAHGDADLARSVALLGDPARAAMLMALLGGEEHSISELAEVAGVQLPTASEHVAALRSATFVEVETRGRVRYVRLVRTDVVEALEALTRIAPLQPVRTLSGSDRQAALHAARLCYDHLAGELGVELFASFVDAGALEPPLRQVGVRKVHGGLGDVALGTNAREVFGRLHIDLERVQTTTRRFAIACLDWSHNRPHLGGALGAEVAQTFFRQAWIERTITPRIVRLTAAGRASLGAHFSRSSSSALRG